MSGEGVEGGIKFDAMESILIITLMTLLVIVVGMPLAIFWWARDEIRKKIQKSEPMMCPHDHGCVTSIKKEDRECPY